MARVVVTPTARDELDRLIESHSLPPGTMRRVARSIEPLQRFPLMGKRLSFRWCELRFILGPWRWMVVVYAYDVIEDTVWIVTIEDGRSPESALGSAGRP